MMWLVCFVLLISVTTAFIPDASRLGQSLVKQVRHRRLQLSAGQQLSCAAMQQAMACNAKAQPTCEGDCEWKADENKCDIGGAAAMQLVMGGSGNSAMTRLMQKGLECNAKTQPTCDGECEWKAEEKKCDISGAATIQLMMGGGENTAMGDLMQKGMMCNAKTQPTCDGECEWKADEKKCDLSGIVAMQLMMGGGDNTAMGDMMQLAVACNAKAQQACNEGCEWIAVENKCDLDPQVAFHKLCNEIASGTSRAFASIAVLAVALSL